jgi:hypothetical protein
MEIPLNAAGEAPPVRFYSVSKSKFAIMSVTTLNIYQLYWFYRNWKSYQDGAGEDILPFWRAFFSVFFCHSLVKKIDASAQRSGITDTVGAGATAVAYALLTLSWKLPDPYWLISILTFLPLLPVQSLINQINTNADPAWRPESRYSWKAILAAGAGSVLLLFSILGSFLPE